MPDNPITVPLPQDLPTNWTYGQTIGAAGTDVGLTQQHGYNYLMQQVNAAQQAAQEIGAAFEDLTAADVGAAPDGFGLGSNAAKTAPGNDANQALTSGWWQASINTPNEAWCLLFVLARGSNVYQDAFMDRGSSGIDSTCRLRRVLSDGEWTQWEWVNPPVQVGVEYQTIERFNRKPVYVKLVNFGALPNATTSTLAHGIANVGNMLPPSGSASSGASIPCENFGGTENDSVAVSADATNIYVTTTQNHSSLTASILLKYTKTTD